MKTHLEKAVIIIERTGQAMSPERVKEFNQLRRLKLNRIDIFGKKINPDEFYILTTKTKPRNYYMGGFFSNPRTSINPTDADFIQGKDLLSMEFHWGIAWDAIPVRFWERTVRKFGQKI